MKDQLKRVEYERVSRAMRVLAEVHQVCTEPERRDIERVAKLVATRFDFPFNDMRRCLASMWIT